MPNDVVHEDIQQRQLTESMPNDVAQQQQLPPLRNRPLQDLLPLLVFPLPSCCFLEIPVHFEGVVSLRNGITP